MNLRDTILLKKPKLKKIYVKEWDMDIFIKSFSAADIVEYQKLSQKVEDGEQFAVFACLSIVDEEGNRVFKNEDIKELAKQSASALMEIFNSSQEDDVEEVEEKKTN